MTDEHFEELLSRLEQRLNMEEPDSSQRHEMEQCILEAEGELLLYLNRVTLPQQMEGKVVELAAVYYRRDNREQTTVKAASYSEGDVSQSETYLSDQDYQNAADAVLRSVAHWRRRAKC